MIKNKKGADKIISVYWFAILFIVAAAIVYMAAVFYGNPYDVRELEARILTDKIAGCLSNEGYINEKWETLNNDNFLEECDLIFDVEDTNGWQDDQYYLEINISNFNLDNELKSVKTGNVNLIDFCDFENGKDAGCFMGEIYTADKSNGEYKINILSVVRKTEKNAL